MFKILKNFLKRDNVLKIALYKVQLKINFVLLVHNKTYILNVKHVSLVTL